MSDVAVLKSSGRFGDEGDERLRNLIHENQLKSPDPCWESHYYEWILEVMATLTHTTTENQLREEQDE